MHLGPERCREGVKGHISHVKIPDELHGGMRVLSDLIAFCVLLHVVMTTHSFVFEPYPVWGVLSTNAEGTKAYFMTSFNHYPAFGAEVSNNCVWM